MAWPCVVREGVRPCWYCWPRKVGDHTGHDGVALRHLQETQGLLMLLAHFARTDGCIGSYRTGHDSTALRRTLKGLVPAGTAGPYRTDRTLRCR